MAGNLYTKILVIDLCRFFLFYRRFVLLKFPLEGKRLYEWE